jgi:hypothetical protein
VALRAERAAVAVCNIDSRGSVIVRGDVTEGFHVTAEGLESGRYFRFDRAASAGRRSTVRTLMPGDL